jgi:hypothetical protein
MSAPKKYDISKAYETHIEQSIIMLEEHISIQKYLSRRFMPEISIILVNFIGDYYTGANKFVFISIVKFIEEILLNVKPNYVYERVIFTYFKYKGADFNIYKGFIDKFSRDVDFGSSLMINDCNDEKKSNELEIDFKNGKFKVLSQNIYFNKYNDDGSKNYIPDFKKVLNTNYISHVIAASCYKEIWNFIKLLR